MSKSEEPPKPKIGPIPSATSEELDRNMYYDPIDSCYVYEDPETGDAYFYKKGKWEKESKSSQENIPDKQKNINNKKRAGKKNNRKRPRKESKNTTIYVTNLPKRLTQQEAEEYFSKAGILKKHPDTHKPLVKLYKEEDGSLRGDAVVTYLLEDSISLAFQLIDDFPMKPGEEPLKVDIATYPYDPKPTSRRGKAFNQKKELSWGEEDQRAVVLKNMFVHDQIKYDMDFYKALENDVFEKCSSDFGTVTSVKVFERNKEGAVIVKFGHTSSAQMCVQVLDGKTFDNRPIKAELYDGYTDFEVPETEEDRILREKLWNEYLNKSNAENDEERLNRQKEQRKDDDNKDRSAEKD